MKRLSVLMVMLAFITMIPSAILANDVEYNNASQWCTANDDLTLQSHGKCVSLVRSCEGPGNTGPVCSCKEFQSLNPEDFYTEYNSLGECISHLRVGYIPD